MKLAVAFSPRIDGKTEPHRVATLNSLSVVQSIFKRRSSTQGLFPIAPWVETHGYLRAVAPRQLKTELRPLRDGIGQL